MVTGFVLRKRVLALALTSLVASLGSSCDGKCPPTSPSCVALVITPVQDTVAGAAFTVVATAEDKDGHTATGFADSVTLRIDSTPGNAALIKTVKAVSGVATFSGLSLLKAGSYVLWATSGFLPEASTGPLRIRAGVASQLVCTVSSDTQVVAMPFSLVVSAHDSIDNLATTFTQNVTIQLIVNPSGATFSPVTVAAVVGEAHFHPSIDKVASGYTMAATSNGLPPATCPPIAVVPAPGHMTWIGGAASDPTDWSNSMNWLPPAVPSSTDTVVIPATPNLPVLTANAQAGPLTVETGATLNTNGFTLAVSGNLDAAGQVTGSGHVVLTGNGRTLRGSLTNLEINGGILLAGNAVAFGTVSITSPGTLRLNNHALAALADLNLTGAAAKLALRDVADTVRVYGNFNVLDGAVVMTGASALLDVGGNVAFSGTRNDTLTAGVMQITGSFSEICGAPSSSCVGSFIARGSHTVVFNGPVPQFVSLDRPAAWHFNHVRFDAGADSVTFTTNAVIAGNVAIPGDNNVRSGPIDTVSIGGDLDETGCGDCWLVVNTVFSGSPRLPSLLMTNVIFTGRATLQGDLAVTGNLAVLGSGAQLAINGHTLTVSGDVSVEQGVLALRHPADLLSVGGSFRDTAAALVMTGASAHLQVQNDVTFQGSTRDTLTAGELRLQGDFRQRCGGSLCTASFPATGTHRVVFEGLDTQRVSFDTPRAAHFQEVEFSNALAVKFESNAVVMDSAIVTGDNIVMSRPQDTVFVCGTLNDVSGGWQVAHTASCSSSPGFDATQYFPIDIQRAAQHQYGSTATAVQVSNHLFGWQAQVGTQLYLIDMAGAVQDQYGSDYTLGAVGVGLYDWRAVYWSALSDEVLPVMPIASDYFFNVDSVAWGLANFESVLITIRNWYGLRVGKTFRLLQPLVVFLQSSRTAAQWNALSESTMDSLHRYDFLYAADSEYESAYPVPGSLLRVVIVPFTGNSPDVWLGAADQGVYAVAPPRASSITCPAMGPLDLRCSDATYAIGHELGHGFGLSHSCDVYPGDPNCANSIMQTGKPQDAILLPGEISTLQTSPFFF